VTSATQLLPSAEVVPAVGGDRSAKWYLLWTMGLLAMAALPLGILTAAGEPFVGALLGALPIGLATLVRPEFGLYVMVLGIPFETFSVIGGGAFTATKILGLFVALVLVGHLVARGRVEVRSGALWFLGAFTAWSALTILVAPLPEFSWLEELTRIQMLGLIFVVLNACWTRAQIYALVWVVFLAAAAAAAASFVLTPQAPAWAVQRATVGGANVNEHAKNLIPAFFLLPALYRRVPRWGRVGLVAAGLVTLVGLGATGSRSAYVAVALGILIMVLVYRGCHLPTRVLLAGAVLVLIGALVAGGIAAGVWTPRLMERLEEIFEKGLQTGGRFWYWKQAVLLGMEHPLLGAGVGAAGGSSRVAIALARVTHNDILMHFAETGVPGLLLYLGFLAAVFKGLWPLRHTGLGAGLIGLFATGTLMSMANPSVGVKSYWLQAGLCIVVALRYRQWIAGGRGEAPAATPSPAAPETAGPVLGRAGPGR